MSVNVTTIKCPHCGATVDVNEGIDTFFCTYCGQQICLSGLSDAAYAAKVQIEEMKHKERLQAMEYANNQTIRQENQKDPLPRLAFVLLIFCFLMSFGMMFIPRAIREKRDAKQNVALQQIEMQMNEAIQAENYDLALIYANQLHFSGSSYSDEKIWNQKRESYIKLIQSKQTSSNGTVTNAGDESQLTAFCPIDSYSSSENYKDVVAKFKKAGFTNIEVEAIADIKIGLLAKENEVDKVTIDGDSEFTKGAEYSADALVRITYHTKKGSKTDESSDEFQSKQTPSDGTVTNAGDESQLTAFCPIDSYSSSENYKDVVEKFKKAGFTNIEVEAIADIKIGLLAKENEVDKVTIDGDSEFTKGAEYSADALVRITYHTKKGSKTDELSDE